MFSCQADWASWLDLIFSWCWSHEHELLYQCHVIVWFCLKLILWWWTWCICPAVRNSMNMSRKSNDWCLFMFSLWLLWILHEHCYCLADCHAFRILVEDVCWWWTHDVCCWNSRATSQILLLAAVILCCTIIMVVVPCGLHDFAWDLLAMRTDLGEHMSLPYCINPRVLLNPET